MLQYWSHLQVYIYMDLVVDMVDYENSGCLQDVPKG